MSAVDVVRKVVERQTIGLMIHAELVAYFDFLGMNGFANVQRLRYEDESREMMYTRKWFSDGYDGVINVGHVGDVGIVPNEWIDSDTRRIVANGGDVKNDVKYAFERWIEWEENSLKVYGDSMYDADNLGDGRLSEFISCIVKCTDREVRYAKDMYWKLRNVDWDSYTVLLMQKDSVKEYKKWMKLDRKENKE